MIKQVLLAGTVAFNLTTVFSTVAVARPLPAPLAIAIDEGEEDDLIFTVLNNTGHNIDELYIDVVDQAEWGEDLTDGDGIEDGEELELEYGLDEDNNDADAFDMKVVWEGEHDGYEESIWSDLDLSDAHRVTLEYDEETDTASAHIE